MMFAHKVNMIKIDSLEKFDQLDQAYLKGYQQGLEHGKKEASDRTWFQGYVIGCVVAWCVLAIIFLIN